MLTVHFNDNSLFSLDLHTTTQHLTKDLSRGFKKITIYCYHDSDTKKYKRHNFEQNNKGTSGNSLPT